MALDRPGVYLSPLVQLGPTGGESLIQLPLYKFYYMVPGYGGEGALPNEEFVVPGCLLLVSARAHYLEPKVLLYAEKQ